MENLTGIFPCFGAFSNDGEIDILIELLDRLGASYSDDLTAENTHLICSLPRVRSTLYPYLDFFLIPVGSQV
jgi:hypothetical protein